MKAVPSVRAFFLGALLLSPALPIPGAAAQPSPRPRAAKQSRGWTASAGLAASLLAGIATVGSNAAGQDKALTQGLWPADANLRQLERDHGLAPTRPLIHRLRDATLKLLLPDGSSLSCTAVTDDGRICFSTAHVLRNWCGDAEIQKKGHFAQAPEQNAECPKVVAQRVLATQDVSDQVWDRIQLQEDPTAARQSVQSLGTTGETVVAEVKPSDPENPLREESEGKAYFDALHQACRASGKPSLLKVSGSPST